ncbi:MAG: electron transfer flavoprotein subunit alpha/FixB family protein [Isosphaeraceae bacterium]
MIIAEVRQGQFEERNLDSIGFCSLLAKQAVLLAPAGGYAISERIVDTVVRVAVEEALFLNPLNVIRIIGREFETRGKPDVIVFTSSSSGSELAAYTAGHFNLPIMTDVSGFDKERSLFYKSYYSDKIFGEFRPSAGGPYVVTVRSGSLKEHALEKPAAASVETMDGPALAEGRAFMGYVEEEKGEIDITKADFLLSVGRGIGSKDEIPAYEALAELLKAVISGSRPVIDKQWLPKARQVGTSGKTVKPTVYVACGISGAMQHTVGMRGAQKIVAINKDPQAPIFKLADLGIVGDALTVLRQLRDELRSRPG